jgi:hypothetical protein
MVTVDFDKVVCGGIHAMIVAVLVDSIVINLGQDACLSICLDEFNGSGAPLVYKTLSGHPWLSG